MQPNRNPDQMSPKERHLEVVAILAKGFLRLKKYCPHDHDKSADLSLKELDLPGHQSVHGHDKLTILEK